jgi:hypothetical protein
MSSTREVESSPAVKVLGVVRLPTNQRRSIASNSILFVQFETQPIENQWSLSCVGLLRIICDQ